MADEGYNPEDKRTEESKNKGTVSEKKNNDGLPDVLDVNTLQPQQLNSLSKSLSGEVQWNTTAFQELKNVLSRLQASLEAVNEMNPESQGREIFIPMTSSMYVPGTLSNAETVLVEIGTGYFVEKKIDAAKKYLKRRIVIVTDSLQKVGVQLKGKRRDLNTVNRVLQEKVLQMQEDAKKRAASGK